MYVCLYVMLSVFISQNHNKIYNVNILIAMNLSESLSFAWILNIENFLSLLQILMHFKVFTCKMHNFWKCWEKGTCNTCALTELFWTCENIFHLVVYLSELFIIWLPSYPLLFWVLPANQLLSAPFHPLEKFCKNVSIN